MSLIQSVKLLAEEENKPSFVSNSTLLQKRLKLLAPSDDDDASSSDDTDTEEEITPKKEATPTRHNRSNSWMSWFSWYSSATKPQLKDSPPTPETSTPKTHCEISSPYQVEHNIHLTEDLSPESSSNQSNSIKDISILIFEQKERIKDLQRDNDLKDDYIKQLEAKVREMHEQKMFAKERYVKLKQKYDELSDSVNGDRLLWNSVSSSVLGVSGQQNVSTTATTSLLDSPTCQSEKEDDDSSCCFTSPLKRNNNTQAAELLLSPTPDLDALLDKMTNLDD